MQEDQQRDEPIIHDVQDDASLLGAALERLRIAEEQARSYLTNWQRTQADLENYRKRAQQERRESMDIANSTLMAKLMGGLDELERAFSRPVIEMKTDSWAQGARLGFQKLKAALESEGVQQIESVGQPFDPRYHQAIMQRPGQEGVVLEEVQKGYVMNGRVLRPSMVVVGSHEDSGDSEEK